MGGRERERLVIERVPDKEGLFCFFLFIVFQEMN